MSEAELKSREPLVPDAPVTDRSPLADVSARPRRRRILPLAVTLVAVAIAVVLAEAMWRVYVASPWTRDGTVRAYVVTMAPQVSGEIVKLPVVDNQFVHKGDLLVEIDPTNYKIAVDLAQAAVEQAQVTAQNAVREAQRRQ